jgi:hypothetical protein
MATPEKPSRKPVRKPGEQVAKQPAKQPSDRKNREERRRERFGRHRPEAQGGWPASQPNPAFGKDEARTGRPDQDQTDLTGPGTGGASEPDGRTPHHEGAHPGDTKG